MSQNPSNQIRILCLKTIQSHKSTCLKPMHPIRSKYIRQIHPIRSEYYSIVSQDRPINNFFCYKKLNFAVSHTFFASVSRYTLTRLVHRVLRHGIELFCRGDFTFRHAFLSDVSLSPDANIKVIWYISNKPVQELNGEKDQVLKDDDERQSNCKDVVEPTVVLVWVLGLEVFLVSNGIRYISL